MGADWSRQEVEATVADYFAMLAAEISGVAYSKAAHRHSLINRLSERSEQSIEFKHANISVVLLNLKFPYIAGYKPRLNYQRLLYDVVSEQLLADRQLQDIAAADADKPIVAPEVEDILGVVTSSPSPQLQASGTPSEMLPGIHSGITVNYLEREARNRSLGAAGEEFVIIFSAQDSLSLARENLLRKSSTLQRIEVMELDLTFCLSKKLAKIDS
jgi:hypothetical protein